ncbi:uncharacterized protein LOC114272782 [Camellia sinensis]|uniref:uncharacterized protein LOC114272782 n=1 Tax=Camellia sinensis TaxID=4442 RepID=UPI001036D43A|nr:uncharacterized protein LOC114272782 [Camellia sinensis]
MPFGLKNARATYQRLVTKIFKHLIEKTMEVYIDDMVMKSKEPADHITNLKEVFDILKAYRLRLQLNASKCAFEVGSDKFFAYCSQDCGAHRATAVVFVTTRRLVEKNSMMDYNSRAIVADNHTQFDSKLIKNSCVKYKIKNYYSTCSFPQSNGQVVASNRTILDGIKKRLKAAKGKWVEELPNVLWVYRTTLRRSNRESLFFMAYGTDAVIPL